MSKASFVRKVFLVITILLVMIALGFALVVQSKRGLQTLDGVVEQSLNDCASGPPNCPQWFLVNDTFSHEVGLFTDKEEIDIDDFAGKRVEVIGQYHEDTFAFKVTSIESLE